MSNKAGRKDLWMMNPSEVGIASDPDDPLFDPRGLEPHDENLVRSILHQGVLEPVICVRRGKDLVVVDGRRRVVAAREAASRSSKQGGLEIKVPVIIRRATQHDLIGVMVATNEIRKDDSVIQKAEKATKLLAAGYTEEELCTVFGVTMTSINNWLALFELEPEVLKEVKTGALSASAAAKLANLAPDEQVKALKKLKKSGKTTAKAAGKESKKKRGSSSRMRGRKEIVAALDGGKLLPGWAECLKWVLRQD